MGQSSWISMVTVCGRDFVTVFTHRLSKSPSCCPILFPGQCMFSFKNNLNFSPVEKQSKETTSSTHPSSRYRNDTVSQSLEQVNVMTLKRDKTVTFSTIPTIPLIKRACATTMMGMSINVSRHLTVFWWAEPPA